MKIKFHSPSDDTYQLYQAYYLLGLKSSLGDKAVEPIYESTSISRGFRKIARKLESFASSYDPSFPSVAHHVGRYVFEIEGKEVKVAIDSHDHRYVWSPDILAWSDVYFKTNYWPSENHIQKVVPLVNGNGFLSDRHLNHLQGLRNKKKQTDLVFISRIWGGAEHNIRLFEALAQAPGHNDLLAVFPHDWNHPLEKEYKKRLDRAGVPHSMKLISSTDLWQRCSEAKINILRAGKYHCVPWRMTDLLAMGASIVSDSNFKAVWPEDLMGNQVLMSLGLGRPMDTSASLPEEYDAIPRKMEKLFSDSEMIKTLSRNSATYFDQHLAPKQVGQYLIDQASCWADQEKISL